MFSMPLPMDCSKIIIAEAGAQHHSSMTPIKSKYRFRNMRTTVMAKGEKAVSKDKGITTSKVHAGIFKKHTAATVELADYKAQLASKEDELNVEKKLRAESERKQLEAEEKSNALARELLAAQQGNAALEAARAKAAGDLTRMGEELLATKKEFSDIIVGVKAARQQCAALQAERDELKAECNSSREALVTVQKELTRSEQQRVELKESNEELMEEIDELKGDLFVQKESADRLQTTFSEEKAKNIGLTAQNEQSITTLKEILPENKPVAADASLDDLAAMVIEHHEYLVGKVHTAQATVDDIKADFNARDKQLQATCDKARKDINEAAGIKQNATSLEQRVRVAEHNASKLPQVEYQLSAAHQKGRMIFNELQQTKEGLKKWQAQAMTQSGEVSQLNKEIAELKEKTGGDDSEAVKKLKSELANAKYDFDMANVELGQTQKKVARG